MFKIKHSLNVDNMGEAVKIGEWRKEKELGSGGFGVVSLWCNISTNEQLAIKKCKFSLTERLSPRQRQRWTSEVEMMKAIRHDNIVSSRNLPDILSKAFSKSNLHRLPVLGMEYCSLGCLRSLLLKPENSSGLSENEVRVILSDISSALTYLHGLNITHRDVKPENIVMQASDRSEGVVYKIIDLGYAKELGDETVSFVGTLQYLAPEIFERENYTKAVDYWSLGITAYEIICGLRPFFHWDNSPALCFSHIKNKECDVISIQKMNTGDVKSTKELPKETHLNMSYKRSMEKWLRTVLQFEPEKRGLIEGDDVDVFVLLQCILSRKIVTVFSFYTFEFYSYEIDSSTRFDALQEWISRDTKIPKPEQYIVTSKDGGCCAINYYDENNPDAMLFLFKKNASINPKVSSFIPKFIKVLFKNNETEFKNGTLQQLHTQVLFLIASEIKHLRALKSGITFLAASVLPRIPRLKKLLLKLRTSVMIFLNEIEFYNMIETSSCARSSKSDFTLRDYRNHMNNFKEIVSLVNTLTRRCVKVFAKHAALHGAFNDVVEKLNIFEYNQLYEEGLASYKDISERSKELRAKPEIMKIISQTLKIRDTVIRDRTVNSFVKAALWLWRELSKLSCCLANINGVFPKVRKELRENVIRRLALSQTDEDLFHGDHNKSDLIKENMKLRTQIQDFMDHKMMYYKEAKTKEEFNSENVEV